MVYVFGDYTLDTQCYELCRAGAPVKLRPKVFQVLTYLLTHHERVVAKHELCARLWPAQVASDETLDSCIALARRAVGDSARLQGVIRTQHGHGYRFVAPVEVRSQPPDDARPAALLVHPDPAVSLAHDAPGVTAALRPAPPYAHSLSPALVHGEHKVVTILVGTFTQAAPSGSPLSPEIRHQAFHEVFTDILEEVQRYGGTLQSLLEASFLALFGAPVAQEDHAQRAVLAALSLRDRLRPAPAGLTYTMGLHTGPVVLGGLGLESRLSYTSVGDTTEHAIWLAQQATPDTILVSAVTVQQVHEVVHLEPCSPASCPAPPGLEPAYRLLGRRPRLLSLLTPGRRPRSPWVGRALELTTLQALLTRMQAGQGQVVGIVGEPGMGKTRLLAEFWQRLGETRLTLLLGQCTSYGQAIPYGPIRDLLRHAWGLTEADSPTVITARVPQHLQSIDLEPAAEAPLLLPLLGVPHDPARQGEGSPQERRAQTFATLHQVLQHESQRQPVVVMVENLHWIDPTSQDYLAEVVEWLAGAPLLLVVTFRPGYRPPWMDKSYATQLTLPRLEAPDSRRVVQAVLHPAPVPEPLLQGLLAKAAGNPLFLEELAWTVREQGDPRASPDVPDTVRAVLASRIDRLPPAAKQVLWTAAVIGTEVPLPLLQTIAEVPEEALQRSLTHLQAAEFLYETRRFPDHTYTFKHALTHEVAYGSLLRERRRVLHVRLVEALEALAPERLAAQVERLAHHALRGAVWAKAVTYCQQVGARAHDRAAFREAVAAFEQALQALAYLPESGDTGVLALDLRLALGYTLSALGEYGQRLALLGEAEALARALADRPRLGLVLTGIAIVRRITGDHDGALAAGQQALALAVELGDRALQILASYTLGRVYWALGDCSRAVERLRWSVEEADRDAGRPRDHPECRPRLPRPPVPRPRGTGARHPGVRAGPGPLSGLGQPGLCAHDRGEPGLCLCAPGAPGGGAHAAGGGDQRKSPHGRTAKTPLGRLAQRGLSAGRTRRGGLATRPPGA